MLEAYVSIARHADSIPQLMPPFSALLYCDEDYSVEQMNSYCDLLIASGCKFFQAIGKNHMKWHLAFDEANIRYAPDLNDDKVISTVSYEKLDYNSIENWVMLWQRVAQLQILPTGDSMKNLVWNVIYHDSNAHKICTFNVFDHCGFMKDIQQHLRKSKDKAQFADELKRSVKYYFWSKCEWEIIISPWTGSRDTEAIKVDVCWQLLNNWERFVDYVWDSKRRRSFCDSKTYE